MTETMWRVLSGEEFFAAIRAAKRSAFRLEMQPVYIEDYEQTLVDAFLAGQFRAPTEVPELVQWFDQVAAQTRAGVEVGRVRIQESPPTTYQQLERWCDPWNVESGESIRYITRPRAHEVGLLPAAGAYGDWWLIDELLLVLITHRPDGRRVQYRATLDSATIKKAAMWRDLAIRHSEPSPARNAAA